MGTSTKENPGSLYVATWLLINRVRYTRIQLRREVVRAAIAIARMFSWGLGMIDVVAAFLQTPLRELKGAPLVYGIPPKALVKAGLCRADELWRFTHAVYGLQESPKLRGGLQGYQVGEDNPLTWVVSSLR